MPRSAKPRWRWRSVLLTCLCLGLAVLLAPDHAQAASGKSFLSAMKSKKKGLFGYVEIRRNSLRGLNKWKSVLKKMRRQKIFLRKCAKSASACPPGAAKSWRRIIVSSRKLDRASKIKKVHAFFNKWPYKLDRTVYKVSDYWATPLEFMARSGDCEDYSITKFYALLELGFRNEDMRIVALVDRLAGVAHAVLAVKYKNTTVILDNRSPSVQKHMKFTSYVPQYSVNETTRWSHIVKLRRQMGRVKRR